jgi:hypothetical protein
MQLPEAGDAKAAAPIEVGCTSISFGCDLVDAFGREQPVDQASANTIAPCMGRHSNVPNHRMVRRYELETEATYKVAVSLKADEARAFACIPLHHTVQLL